MTVNRWEQADPGVTRKIHTPGEKLMMMEVSFEEGAEGSSHSHPHEQLTYCLEGKLAFHVDGKEIIVEKGDSLRIPSNAVHGVKALTKSQLLDVFTPLREDLLD
ncbi:Cupin domain-containing protein [Gracilibacillus orientalis]|uniref:Cupin domain-containing protein n=1 Tax=Gracilibacillus orientalis TaxID=334253 RepID=A0A1I4JMK7_9BACI|nr:cupin domain-containing protein [Gracilibacillus orientalis]SFL67521.1 Cupin domain-containing protein [Gracilibacillus orientalis]